MMSLSEQGRLTVLFKYIRCKLCVPVKVHVCVLVKVYVFAIVAD